jgi:hypothetical protein
VPIPGDYNADGKTDIAVWRPEGGVWYLLKSDMPGNYRAVAWGLPDDKPLH